MSKQIEFKTNHTTYVFQHPGIRYVDEMSDKSKDRNSRPMPHRYNELMMENVIVEPGVSYAYFDELEKGKKETHEINGQEYTLVHPGSEILSKMAYYFADSEGRPSEVSMKEQFMQHIIQHDGKAVSYDFFDKIGDIKGFNEITTKAAEFMKNTEFMRVMSACRQFLNGEEIEG